MTLLINFKRIIKDMVERLPLTVEAMINMKEVKLKE